MADKKLNFDPIRVLNSVSDFVLIKGPKSRLLWANDSFLEYYGMERTQLENIVDSPHSDPDDTLQYVKDDQQVFSTQKSLRVDEPVTHHTGKVEYFDTIKSAIIDDKGQTIGTVGLSRPILSESIVSRSKEVRLDRKNFTAFQKTFLDQIAVAALFLDSNNRVTSASPTFCSLFRTTESEVIDKQLEDILTHATLSQLQFGNDLKHYEQKAIEVMGHSLVGDLSITPWLLSSGVVGGHLMVFENRTEELELTKLLREEKQQTVINDRIRALGLLSAGVAHEINNPLATIGLITSKLQMVNKNLPDEVSSDLEKIQFHVRRIADIVTGLKTLSRDSSRDSFEHVEISSILEPAISLLNGKIRHHLIDIDIKLDDDFSIHCRPGEISQVIHNLINNAIDAIQGHDKPWIKVRSAIEDNFKTLTIIDSGSGIPDDVLEKIFDPFFTTKKRGEGTGLGLGICLKIIKSHGGDIVYETIDGHTCFKVKFAIEDNQ